MTIFATLTPIDPGTNTRVTVRLCASQDEVSTGAAGEIWWPAISQLPVIQSRFFDGDFSSAVDAPTSAMDVRLDVLIASGQFPRVEQYDWADAECRLQRLSGGSLVDVQLMQVDSFASEDMVLGLRLRAAQDLFNADVLRSTYAGTTGAEGGADLKGQLKPWIFGRALNVEPVFIDQIDSVFQVSGYGAVQAISAVYERGASFGASIGDFANYAALVAANIPEGRWGTCLAQGMFRLGAPPAGVITCDVDGDNVGGFLRRTGAILSQIATRIGLVDKVDATSMTALDAAVARNVNIVIREQTSFMELAQRMLAPCNAVGSVAASGRLIASRVDFGSEQFTLDAQGREMPPVLGMARQNTSPPYKRVQMGAARSWRVHTFDEIAFFAELIDRGLYSGTEVYREGNIVELADKSRWVYVNPTASSGNAPPTWPTASNAFWSNIAPPIGGDLIGSIVAPANANRVPFSRMEGDRGWGVNFNPSSLAATTSYGTTSGLRFFRASVTATAASQDFSIGHAATSAALFVLTPGTRVSVQARLETTGVAAGPWRLALFGFTAGGSQSEIASVSGSGLRALTDAAAQMFVDVPAGIIGGRLEFYTRSTGAGAFTVAIAEPMVTSAAPGQTIHPPYTPGPNAVDGALPNNLITVDGGGVLSGIGTANINVDNRRAALQGLASARPASGQFVGQEYHATDTGAIAQWDGFNWRTSADITAAAQITFTTPSPFQIQADSSGVTTTDLATQQRSITLLRGGVAQTSGVTVGTPTGNPSAAITIASATVSGGIVTVTLAAANASGSVTIPIIFGGVTYPVTIPVNRTIAPPPSGGSGDTLFSDGSWANINTTTYTQVTDSGATVRSTSGGQLSFGFSAQYNGGNVQCKAQYSPDGTTWSDVAGTETTGTGAITVPGEEEPGSISRAPVTQSSLAASTLYFVRLVARRTGGTGTISWIAPSFTARQP